MVEVPALIPLMTAAVSVATAVLLLLHTPPAGVAAKVVVSPSQTLAVPVITAGNAFTVTTSVL